MPKIKLYHYSNADIKGYIRPSFFGKNNYTNYSRDICALPRSYFYVFDHVSEFFFNSARFKYIVNVDKKRLYNIQKDPHEFGVKFNGCIYKIFRHIKKLGYKGIIGNNGYGVVSLFYDVKINKKIILTK